MTHDAQMLKSSLLELEHIEDVGCTLVPAGSIARQSRVGRPSGESRTR